MKRSRPQSAPYLPVYKQQESSRAKARPTTAGPASRSASGVRRSTSSSEQALRADLRQMVRGAVYAGGVYVKDPLKANTRHYCATPDERARSLAGESGVAVSAVREPLRNRQLRDRPTSVSALEIEERRRRCRRTVDEYRKSGGPGKSHRPQSASCVESWEGRMHEYVKQEAAWIRSRVSGSAASKRTRTREGKPRVLDTSAVTERRSEEEEASREGSADEQEEWVHEYFRMCSNSMDLRQHFLTAEELLSRQDTPIGPSAESCQRALVHLGVFLQEHSMNLRARMMQRRAVGLAARHRLGEQNVETVLGVAKKQGLRNETEINQFMKAMADEGFDDATPLKSSHAQGWLTDTLSANAKGGSAAGPQGLRSSVRRAPGSENRKPLAAAGRAAGRQSQEPRQRQRSGFDSMALGRIVIFPDGTSRAVFSEEAYEDAMEKIRNAPKRR